MKTTNKAIRCKSAKMGTKCADILLAVAVPVIILIMVSNQSRGVASNVAMVVTYPAPASEVLSTDYKVQVAGRPVDVYMARVLDPPFAGKQWDHGGSYSFTNFDMSGRVEVRIVSKRSLRNVVIRPQSSCERNITLKIL